MAALVLCLAGGLDACGAEAPAFPRAVDAYGDPPGAKLFETLRHRAATEPFNLVATGLFLLAVIHSFLCSQFMKWAHRWRDAHAAALATRVDLPEAWPGGRAPVSFQAEMMHFLGEVEAVFGIWSIPLLLALFLAKGPSAAEDYVSHGLHFTEPLFVVVIMCIAATRPILQFAEKCLRAVARLGGGGRAAWWLSILTIGPLFGSFITEPAAMTICALLLARQFYDHQPGMAFRYATLGLLFVNVSIGGTLTHFAAPPVLMVAGKWGWGIGHMLGHFGWKAALAIVISNAAYLGIFHREFKQLREPAPDGETPADWRERTDDVPTWIIVVHLGFLGWTVLTAHHPVFFIGGFLILLAFTSATEHHQNPVQLKPAILVGFFLAGLVIHGGLQGWWIAPVLSRLSEIPLFLGGVGLTAVNDNAAITYLASLVPDFSPALQHAIVAGAVTGGGLTVIANAPNPAGQSILCRYFGDGVSPLKLFVSALLPTAVAAAIFLIFR